MNIANLPDPKEFPALFDSLSPERKKKISRYRQTKDRKQSLGAGLLLQQIFKERGLDETKITYGAHGKPGVQDIHFNLSHSHDYVVCAVGDKAVGCDVEKIGQIRERVAERFFTRKEAEHLASFEGEEKVHEFYRIWTMKESYMKMTGEGLSLDTKRIEFSLGEKVRAYRDGICCSCFLKEYELPGYKLTVCSEEKDFAETMELLPCLKY